LRNAEVGFNTLINLFWWFEYAFMATTGAALYRGVLVIGMDYVASY